jgi:aryl-alcohol dehydrogenase-like predicted oxidoreductase
MEYRTVGASGLVVSAIGLGTTNFSRSLNEDESSRVVAAAIDAGVTLFDSAEVYNEGQSEVFLGKALGARRQDVIIATKFGQRPPSEKRAPYHGGSRHEMMAAVDRSLRRLKTDYIDLYQLHQPDPLTPIEETLRGLDDLIRQGKVRYAGVSNQPAWRVAEAQLTARQLGLSPLVSCQDEYSVLVRNVVEPELSDVVQAHGVGLLPYTALASGLLTGKYRRDEGFPPGSRFAATGGSRRFAWDKARFTTDNCWEVVEGLRAFAEARGHTLLELAFGWLLARPAVSSIIAGATSAEQIDQNAAGYGWKLTKAEMTEIDRICLGEDEAPADAE